MTQHSKALSYLKVKLETFSLKEGDSFGKLLDNLDNMAVFNTQQEFLNILVHSADISNPTRPLEIYKKWADLIMKEFWQQGDKEKALGIPVSFLCDRNTFKCHTSQIGFIDGIVLPMYQCLYETFPGIKYFMDNIEMNKNYYKKIKEEEEKANLSNLQINLHRNSLKSNSQINLNSSQDNTSVNSNITTPSHITNISTININSQPLIQISIVKSSKTNSTKLLSTPYNQKNNDSNTKHLKNTTLRQSSQISKNNNTKKK